MHCGASRHVNRFGYRALAANQSLLGSREPTPLCHHLNWVFLKLTETDKFPRCQNQLDGKTAVNSFVHYGQIQAVSTLNHSFHASIHRWRRRACRGCALSAAGAMVADDPVSACRQNLRVSTCSLLARACHRCGGVHREDRETLNRVPRWQTGPYFKRGARS